MTTYDAFFSPLLDIWCSVTLKMRPPVWNPLLCPITKSKMQLPVFQLQRKIVNQKSYIFYLKSNIIKTNSVHFSNKAPITYTFCAMTLIRNNWESYTLVSLSASLVPKETETVSVYSHEHFVLPSHRCSVGFQGSGFALGVWGIKITNLLTFLEWDTTPSGNNDMSMMEQSVSLLSWGMSYGQYFSF